MSFLNAYRYLQKNIFRWTIDQKPVPTILAVRAAAADNRDITESDLVVDDGKFRPLKINYMPPTCDDDGECTDTVCSTGITIAPLQDWFEISQCTASAVYTIPFNDLRYIDGQYTFTDHGVETIASMFPTVREKLSEDIAAMLVAEVGVLPDGHASMSVPIMDPTTGGMAPQGFWMIQRQYLDSGYAGVDPYILGGSQVYNWMRASEIAGMQTTAGFDFGKMRPPANLYYDKLINDTFADTTVEHILTFNPKMIKFVAASKNAGIFATDITNVQAIDAMFMRGYPELVKGGLIDPRTGILWDMDINFVKCNDNNEPEWRIQLRLWWDIFFMSPRVCNIQGLNSIFHFTTCLPQQPECGDNPYPSPAQSDTFSSATGSLTFPLIVQKVGVVDGSNNDLNVFFNNSNAPTSIANAAALDNFLNTYQNLITVSEAGGTLSYTGYQAVRIRFNDTTTLTFA